MTMSPPTMTSREVQRSTPMRRSVRAGDTAIGRAGIAGPPEWKVSALTAIYWILPSSSLAIWAGIGK